MSTIGSSNCSLSLPELIQQRQQLKSSGQALLGSSALVHDGNIQTQFLRTTSADKIDPSEKSAQLALDVNAESSKPAITSYNVNGLQTSEETNKGRLIDLKV